MTNIIPPNNFQTFCSTLVKDVSELKAVSQETLGRSLIQLSIVYKAGAEIEQQQVAIIKIANIINFERRFSSTSIKGLVANKTLKEDAPIKFINSIITHIANILVVGQPTNGEIIARIIYNKYGRYSVADFYKFLNEAVKLELANDYQHLKQNGLSPEVILRWFEQFNELRKKDLVRHYHQSKKIECDYNLPYHPDVEKRIKLMLSDFEKNKEKIRILTKKKESTLACQTLEQRIHNILSREIFPFYEKHRGLTNNDLNELANTIISDQIKSWKKEREKDIIDIPEKEFITTKKKQWLQELQITIAPSAHSILYRGLIYFAHKHQVENQTQLFQLLYPDSESPNSTRLHLGELITKFACKINGGFNDSYNHYQKDMLKKDKTFDSSHLYNRRLALEWLIARCKLYLKIE